MEHTIVLVIINVAASIYAWNNRAVYSKWMMNPYKVNTENQYYRFISSGFIHGDWVHLIFNMIALYSFGRNFEFYLAIFMGADYIFYFYGIYFTALVVSEIPTYLKHKDNPNYNSLGASGAVSAIIFACAVIAPLSQLRVFFIPMPAFVFGFLYLWYSYYLSKKGMDGVNHDAHFYGAIYGIIAIIFIHPTAPMEFIEQILSWNPFK